MAVLALVAALLILSGAYAWAVARAKAVLSKRLAKHGLELQTSGHSWSPWGGLTLSDAALRRLSPAHEPLIELSGLHVDVLWMDSWKARDIITHWHTQEATLALHDAAGVVNLTHLSMDFVLGENKIEIAKLDTTDGPVTFALSGQILTAGNESPKGDFSLDLQPVRAVLHAVAIKPGTGPLTIGGSFDVDLQKSPSAWTATLHGQGKNVNWRGLPMKQAALDARLSQAGLNMTCALALNHGSTKIEVKREEGWEQPPLNLAGTLTDGAGQTDEFSAIQDSGSETLTISKMSGRANVIELAGNMPALAAELPKNLTFRTFPGIAARDLVWHSGEHPTWWTLASLQTESPAAIEVMVRDKPLAIDHLTGRLSRDREAWKFEHMKGRFLGGGFALDGIYNGKALREADVSIESLRLAKLSPWMGKVGGSLHESELSLKYHGAVCGDASLSSGKGSLELNHAPVVHLPLIDQAYELFPSVLPAGHGVGDCRITFSMTKGIATIDPLKADSESVVITGTGTVDLVRRRVSGTARANLRGVVGVVTSPLSHVLAEMKVSGPIDDMRVTPLNPVSEVKQLIVGTAKAATGSAKLSGGVLEEGLSLPFEALGIFGKHE